MIAMDPLFIGFGGLAVLLALIAIRVPIAVALFSVAFFGLWLAFDQRMALGLLNAVPYSFAASWTLSSVPLFLFMGFVAYHTGLTQGLFRAARAWVGSLPGGLAVSSVLAAGGFSAVTGSSVACAAAMGRIAVPEMEKSGYDPGIATGSVAAAGTIGALIPPSILLILYGIQAEVSILKLFFGGLVVGLISVIGYSLTITLIAWRRPELLPRGVLPPMRERFASLIEVWPVILLVVGIFSGMMVGWFTTTEAAAIGALLTVLIGAVRRLLTFKALRDSAVDTLLGIGSLFVVAMAANAFTRFIALTGVTDAIGDWVAALGLSDVPLLALLALLFLLLGMFLEPIGAMLLILPILLPILDTANISYLWFGLFVAKLLEIGMITPPVGLNVFVLHGVANGRIKLETIFKGVSWFILADLIVVILMIATREQLLWLIS